LITFLIITQIQLTIAVKESDDEITNISGEFASNSYSTQSKLTL
jgi:hypothetical protein